MIKNNKSERWPIFLRKMSSPEIKKAVKSTKIVILPVGSIEQHGEHLPIDTDLTTIDYLTEEGLKTARQDTGNAVAFIAPSIPYGGPGIGMIEWPGTICLRPSTLIEIVYDVGIALVSSGFQYIVIINGCVGNIATLTLAVQQFKRKNPVADYILFGSGWEMAEGISHIRTSEPGGIGHAGEMEASTSLVIDPDHVKMDKAVKEHIHHPSPEVSFDFGPPSQFYWPYPFSSMTKSGVIGDPTVATKEKGEAFLSVIVKGVSKILQHILMVDKLRENKS